MLESQEHACKQDKKTKKKEKKKQNALAPCYNVEQCSF